VRVLAHLLSPLLVLHLSATRQALAFALLVSSVSSDFPRTIAGAPVTAPGQILFPVEFKTPRNTRIYFTDVPRAAGRDEERRGEERRGFTSDPTRLVNVTKKRCILRRREKQRSTNAGRRVEEACEGRRRKSRFLEIIIPWTIATLRAIWALLFFQNYVFYLEPNLFSFFFFKFFFFLV